MTKAQMLVWFLWVIPGIIFFTSANASSWYQNKHKKNSNNIGYLTMNDILFSLLSLIPIMSIFFQLILMGELFIKFMCVHGDKKLITGRKSRTYTEAEVQKLIQEIESMKALNVSEVMSSKDCYMKENTRERSAIIQD